MVKAREEAAAKYPACMKPTPAAEDVERARTMSLTAIDVADKDPKQAINLWTVAYGFDCSRPRVFENIAKAYGKAGEPAMAIAVMEIYVARVPNADGGETSQLMSTWRMELGPPQGENPKPGDDVKPKPSPGNPQPDAATKRPFGPGPWIVFAVGGAAMIGGAAVLAVGRIDVADAEEQCGGHTNCTPEQIDLGNGGNTLTGVGAGLLGGGAAIAIAGLIWQFAGNKPVAVSTGNEKPASGFFSPRVEFDPSFAPGWFGGVLRGAF